MGTTIVSPMTDDQPTLSQNMIIETFDQFDSLLSGAPSRSMIG